MNRPFNIMMKNYNPSWRLLKLLDDDYLLSELTAYSYEVDGKREV